MCFGSSPGWNDGVGNIGIFSDFSLNFNFSNEPKKKVNQRCLLTSSYKIAKDAIIYVSDKIS